MFVSVRSSCKSRICLGLQADRDLHSQERKWCKRQGCRVEIDRRNQRRIMDKGFEAACRQAPDRAETAIRDGFVTRAGRKLKHGAKRHPSGRVNSWEDPRQLVTARRIRDKLSSELNNPLYGYPLGIL